MNINELADMRPALDVWTDPYWGIRKLKEAMQYEPLSYKLDKIDSVPRWRGFFNYALLNCWKEPIYIGRTIDPKTRLSIHRNKWNEVWFYWLIEFDNYHDMIDNETIMINELRPRLNAKMRG